ncbi:MAG: glycosyltransferase [Pyrinomonadaceae bacterium]
MFDKKRDGVASVYIVYWSLRDPLCQTQSLAYLRKLAARGYRFALITFEQTQYALDRRQAEAMKQELVEQGIYWYPLRYHKRFSLLATAFDCVCGIIMGAYVAVRHKARVVHSRASIPAAMALVLARLWGLKFLYDADSALSEEYADIGHWRRDGLAYKTTARLESAARTSAQSVIVLTEQLRQDFINEYKVRAPVTVIPCCVDTNKFRFNADARARRRSELELGDEKLFIYVGKIGSWYLVDETFEFFKAAQERIGNARLLVLTSDAPEIFHQLAARYGISQRDYHVKRAAHEEVPEWLSASDVGLAFIRSVSSKRGSSPIKTGEYLSIGLPVVITSGIGDYSSWIEREQLGAVIDSLTVEAYRAAADKLLLLWGEGARLRERCRKAAEAHVSLDDVGLGNYQAVYERLL